MSTDLTEHDPPMTEHDPPSPAKRKGSKRYIILAGLIAVFLVCGLFLAEPIDWESDVPVLYLWEPPDMGLRLSTIVKALVAVVVSAPIRSCEEIASASFTAKVIAALFGVAAIGACVLWYWLSKVKSSRSALLRSLGSTLFAMACILIVSVGGEFCGDDMRSRLVNEGKAFKLGGVTYEYTGEAVDAAIQWGFLIAVAVLLLFSYLLTFRIKKQKDLNSGNSTRVPPAIPNQETEGS